MVILKKEPAMNPGSHHTTSNAVLSTVGTCKSKINHEEGFELNLLDGQGDGGQGKAHTVFLKL